MNRNRYDLAVEFAFLLCFVSILLGTKSQFILVFTSYAKALATFSAVTPI